MEAELAPALINDIQHAELPATVEDPPQDLEAVIIPEVPVQAVANQLGDVAMDTVRLAELQIRLFEAECRQSGQQLMQPIVMLAAVWLIAVASLVMLLVAGGHALHELTGWPLSVSYLLSSVIGVVLAVITARYAVSLLQTPRISFAKSKDEFLRNIEFLTRMVRR